MASKHAGTGAAVAVLVAVGGLMVLVGVILLLMWAQPEIEHRPSERRQHGASALAHLVWKPIAAQGNVLTKRSGA